jgi:hypothetical protein
MSNEHFNKTDSDERRLGEQLKSEALAERPAFSANLHARVMAAVSLPDNSAAASEPLRRQRTIRRIAIKWAAIAAGLLIAALGINQLRHTDNNSLPPPAPSNHSTDLVVTSKSPPANFSFDDLNHSAGVAIRLVVDQLPIDVPADDWGLPSVE